MEKDLVIQRKEKKKEVLFESIKVLDNIYVQNDKHVLNVKIKGIVDDSSGNKKLDVNQVIKDSINISKKEKDIFIVKKMLEV